MRRLFIYASVAEANSVASIPASRYLSRDISCSMAVGIQENC